MMSFISTFITPSSSSSSFVFVGLFLEESCSEGQLKLRETYGRLNGIMRSFVVAVYAYLSARSSCRASVPENRKVERNNLELRIFPTKINF